MIILHILLACTGGTSKAQEETGDPSAGDTADSVDSHVETGDETAESETAEESGDTGDTYPYTEWSPGDEVPGWEDADCTEAYPGRTYVLTFPDIFAAVGGFLNGLPGAGPHLYTIQLRDCANFPCASDTLAKIVPYVAATLDGTAGDMGQPRGIGEWGPDNDGVRQVQGDGRSLLMDWTNHGGRFYEALVTVCFERVRPDEVRGSVRAEVPLSGVNYYDSLVYRFPFDVMYPDHSGFDSTQPDVPADQPDGYTTAHFVYDQPYDGAWPWDDITDPSIREQVYERYAPYNAP